MSSSTDPNQPSEHNKELGLEDWYQPDAYKIVYERLLKHFPSHQIYISQDGFEP